jgi:hypothetical protein
MAPQVAGRQHIHRDDGWRLRRPDHRERLRLRRPRLRRTVGARRDGQERRRHDKLPGAGVVRPQGLLHQAAGLGRLHDERLRRAWADR